MFATAGYRDLQIEGEGARIRRKDVNARNMAKGLQALLEGETRHAISAVAG
jgi:hypothetical protein